MIACSSEDSAQLQQGESSSAAAEASVYDSAEDPALYRDMNGRKVDMASGNYANHSPEQIRQISDYGAESDWLSIPEVGLDVPLGTIYSYDGVIEPIGFSQAYIVGDYSPGYHDPAAGSLMIAAHALDGEGFAPGNYVWDSATGQAKIGEGAAITVAQRTYLVTKIEEVPKQDIAANEELWAQSPGSLHFVTCVPNSDRNLIISAMVQN